MTRASRPTTRLSGGNKDGGQFQWKELYDEVITSGLCTGCAGCVIACPHDVIGYDARPGRLQAVPPRGGARPRRLHPRREGLHLLHPGVPRFRAWEPEADEHLFARVREPDEPSGIYQDILLTRASDDMVHKMGQDGGLVSALLIWALDKGYIDAALTSYLEAATADVAGRRSPASPRTKEEILAGAGSRYTYSANTLALQRGARGGFSKLALVGMSCQTSVPPVMWTRKVGKIGKPFLFNIGLLLLEDASTTPSSRSSSWPSTASPRRRW